jgi:peptidoglycan/xylan/chitin deacetylase (PgdA/CDA1 family)
MLRLPFEYSPVVERPPLEFPGGARVAVYVLVNVEYFEPGKPALSLYAGTASFPVDPLNYGWRDYGPRVGIWRMFDLLDRFGITASAALNSDVCAHYPAIVEAGCERKWAWIAHGKNNSTMQGAMQEGEEREYLRDVVATIEAATGSRPRGWLGPSLTETENTPAILQELGLGYVLDWGNDDQPYPLTTEGMVAVPYPSELHDIPMLVSYGWTGVQFADAMIEQFDVLYEEGQRTGSVFGLGLNPFLVGQPFRIRHLERVLAHIVAHDDVWVTTSDEIATHYRSLLEDR